jgi:hypothetical protein
MVFCMLNYAKRCFFFSLAICNFFFKKTKFMGFLLFMLFVLTKAKKIK